MLDIGLSEFVVIGVVALVVIGPERLPKVAKTAGHLVGRMQRYVAEVKADINREVEMSDLKDLKKSMDDAAETMNSALHAQVSEITNEVKKAEEEFGRLSNPMMHFGMKDSSAASSASSAGVGAGSAQPEDVNSRQLDLAFSSTTSTPEDAGASELGNGDAKSTTKT